MKKDKKFKLTLNKETLSNMENVVGGDKLKSYMNYTCDKSRHKTACQKQSWIIACFVEATKAKPCAATHTQQLTC